jgi:DNA-binding response OmpR family regulator
MKCILIAEDDAVMVRLLQHHFHKFSYRTVVCREGSSVQGKMESVRPDLAILDLMLPGRSGFDLISDFKGDPDLEGIPLVVVTGQGKGTIRDELLAAGAAEVFTKPFSPTALLARIERLIGSGEEGREGKE